MIDNKRKFEFIFGLILFFLFIISWTIAIIYYYELENKELWTIYFIIINSSIVVLWKYIAKWIRSFENNRRIKIGKKFEFFFFTFLFLSTYFFCFIIAKFSLIFMSILFSLSVISAIYCGWFHYFEEIYEPKSPSKYESEPYFNDKQYIILLTVMWIILLTLFFYFLLI